MSLQTLKNLNLERIMEVGEAVALLSEANAISVTFSDVQVEAPEWLGNVQRLLRDEIARRTRENDLASLRDIEAEIISLRSASERKQLANTKAEQLRAKLGIITAGA